MHTNLRLPIVFALLIISLLFFTSCSDVQQDLKLNNDGSGQMEVTIDLGEFISFFKGMEELGGDWDASDIPEDPNEEIEDKEVFEIRENSDGNDRAAPKEKDPMEAFMDKITDPTYDRDIDTLFSMLSIMPDSVRNVQTRLDLAERIFIRIKSPASSEALTMGIMLDFDNKAHYQKLMTFLESIDSNPTGDMMPMPISNDFFLVFDLDKSAGKLVIDSMNFNQTAESLQMGTGADVSEDMAMMEMMFGGVRYKSTIHVPGEVISCSNPDAIITKDNKVMLEYSLFDVMQKRVIPGFTINFRNRP